VIAFIDEPASTSSARMLKILRGSIESTSGIMAAA
jgi:hypothetical protein